MEEELPRGSVQQTTFTWLCLLNITTAMIRLSACLPSGYAFSKAPLPPLLLTCRHYKLRAPAKASSALHALLLLWLSCYASAETNGRVFTFENEPDLRGEGTGQPATGKEIATSVTAATATSATAILAATRPVNGDDDEEVNHNEKITNDNDADGKASKGSLPALDSTTAPASTTTTLAATRPVNGADDKEVNHHGNVSNDNDASGKAARGSLPALKRANAPASTTATLTATRQLNSAGNKEINDYGEVSEKSDANEKSASGSPPVLERTTAPGKFDAPAWQNMRYKTVATSAATADVVAERDPRAHHPAACTAQTRAIGNTDFTAVRTSAAAVLPSLPVRLSTAAVSPASRAAKEGAQELVKASSQASTPASRSAAVVTSNASPAAAAAARKRGPLTTASLYAEKKSMPPPAAVVTGVAAGEMFLAPQRAFSLAAAALKQAQLKNSITVALEKLRSRPRIGSLDHMPFAAATATADGGAAPPVSYMPSLKKRVAPSSGKDKLRRSSSVARSYSNDSNETQDARPSWYEEKTSFTAPPSVSAKGQTAVARRPRRAPVLTLASAASDISFSDDSSFTYKGDDDTTDDNELAQSVSLDRRRRRRMWVDVSTRQKLRRLRRLNENAGLAFKQLLDSRADAVIVLAASASIASFLLGMTLRYIALSRILQDTQQSGSLRQLKPRTDGGTHVSAHPGSSGSAVIEGELETQDDATGNTSLATLDLSNHISRGNSSFFFQLKQRLWDSLTLSERVFLYGTALLVLAWFAGDYEWPWVCEEALLCRPKDKRYRFDPFLDETQQHAAVPLSGATAAETGPKAASGKGTDGGPVGPERVPPETAAGVYEGEQIATARGPYFRLHHRKHDPLSSFHAPDPAVTAEQTGNTAPVHATSMMQHVVNHLAIWGTITLIVTMISGVGYSYKHMHPSQESPPSRDFNTLLHSVFSVVFGDEDDGARLGDYRDVMPPLPTASGQRLQKAVTQTEEDVVYFISAANEAELSRLTVAAQQELLRYVDDMKSEKDPLKQALMIVGVRELIERFAVDQLLQDINDVHEAAAALGADIKARGSTRASRSSTQLSAVPPLTAQEELHWCTEVADHARDIISWIDEEERLYQLLRSTAADRGWRRNSSSSSDLLFSDSHTSSNEFAKPDVAERYFQARRSYYSWYIKMATASRPESSAFTDEDNDVIKLKAPHRVDLFQTQQNNDLAAIKLMEEKHPQLKKFLPTYPLSWRLPLP